MSVQRALLISIVMSLIGCGCGQNAAEDTARAACPETRHGKPSVLTGYLSQYHGDLAGTSQVGGLLIRNFVDIRGAGQANRADLHLEPVSFLLGFLQSRPDRSIQYVVVGVPDGQPNTLRVESIRALSEPVALTVCLPAPGAGG